MPNQGAVSNGGSSLMRKDFNGVGWAANHDADFKQLIASARAKQSVPSAPADAMAKEPKGLSEPLEVFPRLSQTPSSEPKSYQQENRYLSDKSSTHCRNQTLWRSSGISQADTDDGSLDSEKEASPLPGSIAEVESQTLKSVEGIPLLVESGKRLEEACNQPSSLDRLHPHDPSLHSVQLLRSPKKRHIFEDDGNPINDIYSATVR